VSIPGTRNGNLKLKMDGDFLVTAGGDTVSIWELSALLPLGVPSVTQQQKKKRETEFKFVRRSTERRARPIPPPPVENFRQCNTA